MVLQQISHAGWSAVLTGPAVVWYAVQGKRLVGGARRRIRPMVRRAGRNALLWILSE